MSRRSQLWIRLVALVGLVGSCSLSNLEDELAGEPCAVDDDCWRTQECAQTLEEVMLAQPGVCAPKGTGCVVGAQLGCTCVPNDPTKMCNFPALPDVLWMTYPKMVCDPTILRCLLAPPGGM